MNSSNTDNRQNTETLEHLLSVVAENREQRCAEVRERAQAQIDKILKQAHTLVRARMHRHIMTLREQCSVRGSAALARNQTLIRQQSQTADKAFLSTAWPVLQQALLTLWKDPASKRAWTEAAIASASSTLLEHAWRIEYQQGFTDEEHKLLEQVFTDMKGTAPTLAASDDIQAGIRIIAYGTVVDATLAGLLQQKTAIEATLIARIRQQP